jgi:cytochrome b involved in lipid metabolism
MATTTQGSDKTTLQTEANKITPIKQYSPKEVAEHNSLDDIWIIVDDGVYDLTNFLSEHPGGKKSMSQNK